MMVISNPEITQNKDFNLYPNLIKAHFKFTGAYTDIREDGVIPRVRTLQAKQGNYTLSNLADNATQPQLWPDGSVKFDSSSVLTLNTPYVFDDISHHVFIVCSFDSALDANRYMLSGSNGYIQHRYSINSFEVGETTKNYFDGVAHRSKPENNDKFILHFVRYSNSSNFRIGKEVITQSVTGLTNINFTGIGTESRSFSGKIYELLFYDENNTLDVDTIYRTLQMQHKIPDIKVITTNTSVVVNEVFYTGDLTIWVDTDDDSPVVKRINPIQGQRQPASADLYQINYPSSAIRTQYYYFQGNLTQYGVAYHRQHAHIEYISCTNTIFTTGDNYAINRESITYKAGAFGQDSNYVVVRAATNVTTLDLSKVDLRLGLFVFQNNNLANITFTSNTVALTSTFRLHDNPVLNYVDMSPLSISDGNNIFIHNNNWTAEETDHILVDLDSILGSNCAIDITGNSMPTDGVTTTYNGIEAINNMIARGNTVTYDNTLVEVGEFRTTYDPSTAVTDFKLRLSDSSSTPVWQMPDGKLLTTNFINILVANTASYGFDGTSQTIRCYLPNANEGALGYYFTGNYLGSHLTYVDLRGAISIDSSNQFGANDITTFLLPESGATSSLQTLNVRSNPLDLTLCNFGSFDPQLFTNANHSWDFKFCGFLSADVDTLITQLASRITEDTQGGTIDISGNTAPTSASDTPKAALIAAGFTLILNT